MISKPDNLIEIGRLRRPWGLKGELLVAPTNDGGLRFYSRFKTIWLADEDTPREEVYWRQDKGGKLYLSLKGITTPEDAKAFSDRTFFAPLTQLPELAKGDFYLHQLVGLRAVDEAGQPLGEILETIPGARGASAIMILKQQDGQERLLPFIREIVREIDIFGKRIVLRLLEEVEVK